jgi:hypothetical protein
MTNQTSAPAPASAATGISGPTVEIQVSAEHWQFFAFVFAALVTLGFGVLDSLSSRISPACSVGVKVIVFFLLGYFTLRCLAGEEVLDSASDRHQDRDTVSVT